MNTGSSRPLNMGRGAAPNSNGMSLKQAAAIARRAQRKIDKVRRQIVERAAPWHALPTAYLEFEIAQKVLEKLERENERN